MQGAEQLEFFDFSPPKMPSEFLGKETSPGGYTKSAPRQWTKEEIDWIQKLSDEGWSVGDIAESVGRTPVSVSIKKKRLGKSNDTYNSKHLEEKYEINRGFVSLIKPREIADVYCGIKSFYLPYKEEGIAITTNDKNQEITAVYHLDALAFMCLMYSQGKEFDYIDLDPFGSAYDCFDLAIKMANKGLAITLGELGHKRWKRLDFVSRFYGISDLKDFTIENLIECIQAIGLRNKKRLSVFAKREWQNIGRVWFTVTREKIIPWKNVETLS